MHNVLSFLSDTATRKIRATAALIDEALASYLRMTYRSQDEI